ncbi:MAG: FtsW/RodA/SpoVE family cell cycle protein [Candidatus Flexifilum sp.]
MSDQSALPRFTDDDDPLPDPGRVIRSQASSGLPRPASPPPVSAAEKLTARSWLATLDVPIIIVVLLLLSIGGMMVYSTTFDWAYQSFGSESAIFLQHVRNMAIGGVVFVLMTLIDYRIWRRFAVVLLLATIGTLIAVLLFSDQVFGARRAFLNGSYQPGELAELIVVIYLAAWLSSKNTKVGTILNGLLPFGILLAVIGGLVMLQPDLSTAATIFVVAGVMYFLAGANLYHLAGVGAVLGVGGYLLSQRFSYAQDRVSSFASGLTDLTQTSYHTQQAIIAFINGGWTGVGLGQGRQKFGFLPAPHTDSIFAVIGEELGVLGAMFVVALFIVFVFRGLSIARRTRDPFGGLLAAGITIWVIVKALLNIAVMLSLVPPTGVALPFISFGGSSLVVVLAGSGLLLSVARVTVLTSIPEGRSARADHDRGWGNRWSRLSSPGGR